MKAQEMRFAEEIIRAKQSLEIEMQSIDSMKEDINKPYWRNMAGVFITSEFEAKIEMAIKKCQTIEVKRFDMEGYRLKDLEKYLVQACRAKLEYYRDV